MLHEAYPGRLLPFDATGTDQDGGLRQTRFPRVPQALRKNPTEPTSSLQGPFTPEDNLYPDASTQLEDATQGQVSVFVSPLELPDNSGWDDGPT